MPSGRLVLPFQSLLEPAKSAIAEFHPSVVEKICADIEQHPIVVVGMVGNPFCKKARVLLEGAKLEHLYWNCGGYLSDWKKRLAIKMWSGWPTFPQVFVRGKLLGGFAELQESQKNGALQTWLDNSGEA